MLKQLLHPGVMVTSFIILVIVWALSYYSGYKECENNYTRPLTQEEYRNVIVYVRSAEHLFNMMEYNGVEFDEYTESNAYDSLLMAKHNLGL